MELQPYVEAIRRQLLAAAAASGDDTRAVAERLAVPLEMAARLTLQDALAAAAEQITCELAPGSVELRLRGGGLEFVVTPPPGESGDGQAEPVAGGGAVAARRVPLGGEGEDGGVARVNLRLPEHLKARVEQAAAGEGLSANAWLVRAAAAALEAVGADRRAEPRGPRSHQRYTGWAR